MVMTVEPDVRKVLCIGLLVQLIIFPPQAVCVCLPKNFTETLSSSTS